MNRRLWLRWGLLALFVVALAVTFLNLGRWQLDRLDQRRDANAVVVAHESAEVRPYAEVMDRVITDDDQWQRVAVSGTFDGDHQLVVRYRSSAGDTGYEIVTPLLADDGRTVLVSRGFARRAAGQDFPATAPAAPAGRVTVTGYVRRDERGAANAVTPADGALRLINSEAIGAWLGRPLVNGYLGLITVEPAQPGDLRPVHPPELTEGPHLSYALQWFAFTLIAGFGLVVLIRNDIRDRKKAEARALRAAAATKEE